MIRTQVQIPDKLYEQSKQLAQRSEISMAELVRRGLEYMVAVSSQQGPGRQTWQLPPAHPLGEQDPFVSPDWRYEIHAENLKVAESKPHRVPSRRKP